MTCLIKVFTCSDGKSIKEKQISKTFRLSSSSTQITMRGQTIWDVLDEEIVMG